MKLAALDIGSNSIHMIVANVTGPASFDVIDREREMVKLGSGAFREGRLREDRIDASLGVLEHFAQIAARHGVERILAVATSAVREATNGAEFLGAVKSRTGMDVRLVTGPEEARLIWLGVRHSVDLTRRNALVLDVGGGSVEVVHGDGSGIHHAESLPLGVQRLKDFFGSADPLPWSIREDLVAHVRTEASQVINKALRRGVDVVVGTSGTLLGLGLATLRARGHDPWAPLCGQVVPVSELRDLAGQLLSMDAAARARVPGVDERRVDTIHFASGLVVALLDLARVDAVLLSSATLREGLVLDHLGSVPVDVRRTSVIELLTRTGQLDVHAKHAAVLAVQIFDGLAKLHGLGPVHRELVEYAALLADIGRFVSFQAHEHLSYQLIRGGGLRGFTDEELEILALTARYHRKGSPKARHKHFADLPLDARRAVKILAGIVRVADGLDRGRTAAVAGVDCDVTKHRAFIRARPAAPLEVWAAQRNASLLARALDVDVEVVP